MHSKAVAATCPYFDRLVNGGLKEAQTRSAELKDVDPETFIRFLEYAYRRDYTSPLWTQVTTTTIENRTTSSSASVTPSRELELEVAGEGFTTQQAPEFVTGQGPFSVTPRFGWPNTNAAPSAFSDYPFSKTVSKSRKDQANLRNAFRKRKYINSINQTCLAKY